MALFRRIFGLSISKDSTKENAHQPKSTIDDFVLTASPHTHPLLVKPTARDEVLRGLKSRKSASTTNLREYVSQTRSVAELAAFANESRCGLASGRNAVVNPYGQGMKLREETAAYAAQEKKYVQEWSFYIKCYAESRFNVSNPPEPPPRRLEFEHFSAPYPPTEEERLQAAYTYNVPVTSTANDKLHRLALIAKKLLQTRISTITFIDEVSEFVKAQYSFQLEPVPRECSIGSHVLLSNEPMVILDTSKDWRLKGNPLVTGERKIGFYAGAPITTFEGQIIGVFAVMDTEPRESFPGASRRKLMDMARLAMTEFENLYDEYEMSRRCSVPSLTISDSTIGSGTSRYTDDSWESSRSSKTRAKLMSVMEEEVERVERNERQLRRGRQRKSSKSSVESAEAEASAAPNVPTNSPKNRQSKQSIQLTDPVDELMSPPPPPPWANRRPKKTQRPKVLVDMPTPPQTPSRSFATPSISQNSLGQVFVNLPPPPSPRFIVTPTEVVDIMNHLNEPDYPTFDDEFGPLMKFDEVETAVVNLAHFPTVPKKTNALSDATFAISMIAQELNYDLVYLLRVKPLRPNLDEQHLLPGGIVTKVITAYGLPEPAPTFDAALHLRALRNYGGIIYQNPNAVDENDEVGYRHGILLPLLHDDAPEPEPCTEDENLTDSFPGMQTALNAARIANQSCRGGIVLAAFSREDSTGSISDNGEVKYLRESGDNLRNVLLRIEGLWK